MSQSGIPHSVVQDARTTARGRKSRIGQVGQANRSVGGDASPSMSSPCCPPVPTPVGETSNTAVSVELAGSISTWPASIGPSPVSRPNHSSGNRTTNAKYVASPISGDGGPRMAPPCHPRQVGRSESTVLTASPCTGGSGCGGDCVLADGDSGVFGELPRPGVHGRRHHPADRGSPTGHSVLEEGVPRLRSGTGGRVAEIT